MNSDNHKQLLQAIDDLELQVRMVKRLAGKLLPQQDWLTTSEFADLTGLKTKTVSNYAGKGRFKRIRRSESGKWLIHKSEVERWT